MKPFLLLATRDDDGPADGEYEAFLARTGLSERELIRHRLEAEPMPELDLDQWSGIMVGGSPFNTTTPQEEKSAVQLRVEAEFDALLDRLVAQDFPFLGACYGIGTLARHQGAVIDSRYAEEVDAPQIALTPQGLADPLCAGMTSPFRAFVAHNDAISVPPPGAVVLATSQACPIQMLRIKNNLYATQFHPELDGEAFAHRQSFYADHGYFAPEELASVQAWTREQDVSQSWAVLRNFVEIYAR
ncbi:MAG: glutamine amidotransferase [Actinomyces urogenitalis]|uniref:glutamine amidotransferase n=1 Tax=Actinomyces urogenitalis TaxID=103621 RepID=UPI0024304BC8|nr:glutamine amidotransferase [Actinomyces urogenitalis]MCI7456212.1 glutamine amidotransferase [Actinomyces urogenitalis]MDY3678580.1 glutamine amidotransferase [Actinomyces urogenitalis]